MNNLQSPQILSDLYRDLRDRRLLPLVVVLVVGMAVVPIALSSSPETHPTAATPAPVATKSNVPAESVVVANPGVRDYKQRLSSEAAKDPFIQQFAAPAESATGDSAGSTAGSTSATGTTTSTGTSTSTSGSTTGGSTTTTTQQPQTQSKFYFYRVKVRAGKLDGSKLTTHDSVGSLAPLPSKQVPAATFLGVNTDNTFQAKAAVFLVSSAVSSVEGEGTCSFAGSACQLLTLKPGEHEDLVWVDGNVYRIQLVKFDLIARHNLPSSDGKSSGDGGGDSNSGSPAGRHFSF